MNTFYTLIFICLTTAKITIGFHTNNYIKKLNKNVNSIRKIKTIKSLYFMIKKSSTPFSTSFSTPFSTPVHTYLSTTSSLSSTTKTSTRTSSSSSSSRYTSSSTALFSLGDPDGTDESKFLRWSVTFQ